ncbi:hypothetical protein GEMRC1_000724 [Eukaryota sp. GEM-RC1]
MFRNLLSKLTTTRFRSVAGSSAGVFAVDTDGILYSWSDSDSLLGRPGTPHIPTQIPHLNKVKSVTCCDHTVVALLEDGTFYAWGRYVADLVQTEGIKDDDILPKPTLVKTIDDVMQIEVSNRRFLFLKKDGTVWAFGKNERFSLGTGCKGDARPLPIRIPYLPNICQIGLSEIAGIALSSDGIVYTWGEHTALGHDTDSKKTFPFPVKDLSSVTVTEVAITKQYFLALTSDGSMFEWGISPGSLNVYPDVLPIKKVDLPPVKDIVLSEKHGFAICVDGTVFGTGENMENRLLLENATPAYRWNTSWSKSTLSMLATAIIPMDSAIFMLDDKQRLFGWGDMGVLGIDITDIPSFKRSLPSPTRISSFTRVSSSPSPSQPLSFPVDDSSFSISFSEISSNPFYGKLAASMYSAVALKPDGSVYAWGDGDRGQLGRPQVDGFLCSGVPIKIPIPTEFPITSISTAALTVYAIDEAGQAYGWGYYIRQMAEGHDKDYNSACLYEATKLKDLSSTAQITGSMYHSVVLQKDGSIKVWGELKAVFKKDLTQAVDFDGFDDVQQVAAPNGCVAGGNGAIYGNGNEEDAAEIAVKSRFIDDVAYITATSTQLFCLLKNGTVYYTLSNYSHIEKTSEYTTPVFVPYLKNIVHVASSSGHVLFVDFHRNLFSMGANGLGQLGLGDCKSRDSPVKVSLNDVKYVAAGDGFSLAVSSNGEVYACGVNNRGQLGDGTFGHSVEFKPINFNLLNNSPPIELPQVVIPPLDDFILPEVDKFQYKFGISKTWGFHYDNDILKMWSIDFVPAGFGSSARRNGSKLPVVVENLEKRVNIRKSGDCIQYDTNYLPIKETPIKMISVGDRAGAILTVEGDLFIFGTLNTGYPEIDPRCDLYHLDHIHSISVGATHVLLLRQDGKVFSFGIGEKGQLGDGSNTVRNTIVPVVIPARVAKVVASKQNSFAITVDGELYGWGENPGFLGIDLPNSVNKPVKLPFADVIAVACGTRHLLVVTRDGKLFGLGTKSLMGLESDETATEPFHVTALEDVVDVAIGLSHSVILDLNGKVYVFGGGNYYCELGKMDMKGKSPNLVDFPLPAKRIFAGESNSAVILVDDSIHICGKSDLVGAECSEDSSEWRKLEI